MSIFNHSLLRIGYRSPGLSGELDAKGKITLAEELDMSIIEPQMMPREFPEPASYTQYRDATDSSKVSVRSVGSFLDFCDPSSAFEAELEQAINNCKALGVSYSFLLAKWPPEGIPQAKTWDLLIGRAKDAVAAYNAAGITVGFEPEWFIGSVERMARLVDRVNDDRLKVNFDPTNFFLYGSDPLEAIRLFSGRMLSGHIKDGIYKKGETRIGEGEVDWPAIFTEFLKREMSMDLYIEHCKSSEQIRQSATAVSKILTAILG